MSPTEPIAAVYVRLSRVRKGERELSLETQEEDCRREAERLGYEVVEVFADAGASASEYRKSDPPELGRLVKRLSDFDAVFAWKQDRLGRDEEEWHAFVRKAAVAETRIVTLDGTDLDPNGSDDRLSPSIRAAVAAQEARNTSIRVRRSLAKRVDLGDPPAGGNVPYGYDRVGRELLLDASQAAVIGEAARRIIAGERLTDVVLDFQRRGIVTSNGTPLRRSTLRGILRGPVVTGRRSFSQSAPPRWEQVLDDETSASVRKALETTPRGPVAKRGNRLLRGFVSCSGCGSILVGATRHGARKSDYVCRRPADGGCGSRRIAAEPLEDYVEDLVLELAATREVRTALEAVGSSRKELDRLSVKLAKLERVADEIDAERGAGRLSARSYGVQMSSNESERHGLERRIGELSAAASPILADAPRTRVALDRWWDTAADGQRRALIAAFVAKVVVAPGRRGDHRLNVGRLHVDYAEGVAGRPLAGRNAAR